MALLATHQAPEINQSINQLYKFGGKSDSAEYRIFYFMGNKPKLGSKEKGRLLLNQLIIISITCIKNQSQEAPEIKK